MRFTRRVMKRFKEWAEREYGIKQRIFATLVAGILVVFIIPFIIIKIAGLFDNRLAIPNFSAGFPNQFVGGVFILTGALIAIWSVVAQLTRGRGTPLPMMATQELLTGGPFKYCRNPMSLGTIVLYLGLAVHFGSYSALGLVGLFSGLLILYIRRLEEPELEDRFGKAYLEYKKRVPFLIPRFR